MNLYDRQDIDNRTVPSSEVVSSYQIAQNCKWLMQAMEIATFRCSKAVVRYNDLLL